jgi:hypothetical protein
MPWKFNPMVDHQTSVSHLESPLDGGNSSNIKDNLSLMREERLWM